MIGSSDDAQLRKADIISILVQSALRLDLSGTTLTATTFPQSKKKTFDTFGQDRGSMRAYNHRASRPSVGIPPYPADGRLRRPNRGIRPATFFATTESQRAS